MPYADRRDTRVVHRAAAQRRASRECFEQRGMRLGFGERTATRMREPALPPLRARPARRDGTRCRRGARRRGCSCRWRSSARCGGRNETEAPVPVLVVLRPLALALECGAYGLRIERARSSAGGRSPGDGAQRGNRIGCGTERCVAALPPRSRAASCCARERPAWRAAGGRRRVSPPVSRNARRRMSGTLRPAPSSAHPLGVLPSESVPAGG